jgi:uncharacterized protein DUF4886
VPRAPSSLNVLFIGNSFTARNKLPEMIASLAGAAGAEMDYQLINMGGASLRMHWNKRAAQRAIENSKFDYVVLQEQSTLPVKNAERMRENVRLFDPVIRQSGAKTALYMTWARQQAPESQRAITDAYQSVGKEIGATVVPVGVAWQNFLAKHEKPVLHDRDKSHPSLAGSYLAACVFLATLFERSPVGIGAQPEGLGAAETKLLQQAAWVSVE